MNLVVDASVAIKWFVEEESHDEAIALADESNRLIAPDLIFSEAANVLRRKVPLGYISHEQAAGALFITSSISLCTERARQPARHGG